MGVRGGQHEGWCDRGAAKRSGPWGPGCVLWSGASNGPKNRVPFIMEWKINVEHLLCSMGGGGAAVNASTIHWLSPVGRGKGLSHGNLGPLGM